MLRDTIKDYSLPLVYMPTAANLTSTYTYTATQWVDNPVHNKLGVYKEYPEIYKLELEKRKELCSLPHNIHGYIATCIL